MTKRTNPWKPRPDDDRVPIGPGDTVSMHCPTLVGALGRPVVVFIAKPQEHQADGLFAGIAQHFRGDGLGLLQQFFGRIFHTPFSFVGGLAVYS